MHTALLEERIAALRHKLPAVGVDTFMVSIAANRYYLSGFHAEDGQYDETAGILLIHAEKLLLATDSRYLDAARREAPLYEVVRYRDGLVKALPALLQQIGTRRLGFESSRISYRDGNRLETALAKRPFEIELVPLEALVEPQRAVKSEAEIDQTRQALSIAEEAFEAIRARIQPGVTEKELAWELEKEIRHRGADALSFPCIVAAGANSALPHAVPTTAPIKAGEPILFDWGARLAGYCSDTSRTLVAGTPDDRFHRVFDTVQTALQKAIAAIKPGANGKAVDAVAREYIHQAGFEGRFGHSLGHGTGLMVHEGPRLSPLKEEALAEGMIVTVEPGIYIPGWGGVRLENQVVIRSDGAEVLNRTDPADWRV
ncbi:MAG: aminopeptidase P family protein [Desulfosarcinaceae bacterium]|nr:aminopeptidase P family protein [Desulfosarcinaceae bacterium]